MRFLFRMLGFVRAACVRKQSDDRAAVLQIVLKLRHGRCALWSLTAVKLLCYSVARVDSKGGETGWCCHGSRLRCS